MKQILVIQQTTPPTHMCLVFLWRIKASLSFFPALVNLSNRIAALQAYSLDFSAHLKKSKWTRSALCFHLPLALLTALTLGYCSSDDDGGGGGSPTPKPTPKPAYFWITDIKYTGNLGGISGANSKCTARAATDASALPGGSAKYTHIVLLGSPGKSPKDFSIANKAKREVRRPDNTKIADSYDDYFDPSKTMDASVSASNVAIFTGLLVSPLSSSGTLSIDDHCQSWTKSDGTAVTGYGAANQRNFNRLYSQTTFVSGRVAGGVVDCESTDAYKLNFICISYEP